MTPQPSIIDLVAGYSAYATADELNVHAAVEAPATTPVCAATAASSTWCAAGAGAAAGGTYKLGC